MSTDALKRVAAEHAVAGIESGMVVGLGTGSTAALAVAALGRRIREEGLNIVGIPTSERTAAQARELGIPLSGFEQHSSIDLTIDGADAVERGSLSLIKGLGAALLREKIVAAASRRMTVMVDETKLRGPIGSFCPVPVEIVRFGWQSTERQLREAGAETTLRLEADGQTLTTDGGNYIVDCRFGAIADASDLANRLKQIVGVVETGLFIGIATTVIVAAASGVEILVPAQA
jgi:ribose 5-phosphate isomerase A